MLSQLAFPAGVCHHAHSTDRKSKLMGGKQFAGRQRDLVWRAVGVRVRDLLQGPAYLALAGMLALGLQGLGCQETL